MSNREIVLIDMDCFYVQVEQRLNPNLKGKPCAVVQYKTWKGGGIIAVGYEARALGVTRSMRGDDAVQKCPDIHLARVPEVRGKADLTRYREAGAEVIAVFNKFCDCVERASVDEAYIDITSEITERVSQMDSPQVDINQIPNSFVEGYEGLEGTQGWLERVQDKEGFLETEFRLAVGAIIVEEMRKAVLEETGFTCSAGISYNKMLAKLACGRNKPNKQTVLPHSSVPSLFESLPIQKIRHLGGKLGAFLTDDLKLKTMGDLVPLSEKLLQAKCGYKTGNWLYNACRGIENESVSARNLPKSFGCNRTYRGKEILDTKEKVKFWLSELSKEVSERLCKDREMNKRIAKSMSVYLCYQQSTDSSVSVSRACALQRYDSDKISSDAYMLIQQFNSCPGPDPKWSPPVTNLGISVGKFADISSENNHTIANMFAAVKSTAAKSTAAKTKSMSDIDAACSSSIQSSFGPHQSSLTQPSSVKDNKSSSTQSSPSPTQKTFKTESKKSTKTDIKKKNSVGIGSFFKLSRGFEREKENPPSESPCSAPELSKDMKDNVGKNRENDNSSEHSNYENACLKILEKDSNGERSDVHLEVDEASSNHDPRDQSIVGFFARKLQALQKPSNSDLNLTTDEKGSCDKYSDSEKISKGLSCVDKHAVTSETIDTKVDHGCLYSEEGEKEDVSNNIPVENEDTIDSSIIEEPLDHQHSNSLHHTVLENTLCDSRESHSYDAVDFIGCDRCGKFILVWEMPEHSDFHFAEDMQREGDGGLTTIARQSQPSGSSSSGKRVSTSPPKGSGKGKKKKRTEDKSIQRLTSFFSKT